MAFLLYQQENFNFMLMDLKEVVRGILQKKLHVTKNGWSNTMEARKSCFPHVHL